MANGLSQKKYYYKIYDTNYKYVTTWSSDVISDPTFRSVINGGPGQLMVQLARKYDNFGEGVDVSLNNKVEIWVADSDNLANNTGNATQWDTAQWDIDLWDNHIFSFIKLYTGYISAYAPQVDDDNEYIDVTLLGPVTDAPFHLLKDTSGNTSFTYSGVDPSTIIKDLITKYRADNGTLLNYSTSSIQTTGTKVTYTFNSVTLSDALNKVIEFSPDNWYWFVDASGIIYYQQANINTPNHQLTIGKDILYSQTTKRIENVINEVSIVGGGSPSLYNIYTRTSSASTYGKKHKKVQDGSVTDNATADAMAKRLLDMFQSPETRTVIQIIDDNGENTNLGANIEAFQIGDTIQLKNLNFGATSTTIWDSAIWDTDVWDYIINYTSAQIMTIVSITYTPDYIEIEASSRLPEVTKDLQAVKNLAVQQAQSNVPIKPTTRSV